MHGTWATQEVNGPAKSTRCLWVINTGRTGGTSLPDQETEEKMESELVLGGAWAWVVLAALAGKGVFPREPVPYLSAALYQTTKPCWAPLPRLIAIGPAIGVVISTETRSQGRASTGPNLILPFPKAVPSGHLGADGVSLHPRSLPSPLLPQLPL